MPRPEPADPEAPKRRRATTEVLILIPVFDNDGLSFDAEHDATFEVHLAKLFQGFSLLPGEGSGGWVMKDGKLKREPWRVYMVAVELIRDGDKLRVAAMFARKHYRQEAIALRYLGQTEFL